MSSACDARHKAMANIAVVYRLPVKKEINSLSKVKLTSLSERSKRKKKTIATITALPFVIKLFHGVRIGVCVTIFR